MMPLPNVFLTRKIPEQAIADAQRFSCVEIWEGDEPVPREHLLEKIHDVEGLYCLLTDRVDQEVLMHAPRLKVVSTMAVGFDHIDIKACTQRHIPVGHTPGILTETTADFAFGLLLCAARRIVEGVDYVRADRWKTWGPTLFLGQDMYAATLGIVGFGRIGQAMAKRATGFGMRVLVTHSSPLPERKAFDAPVQQVGLNALLKESDFVSLHIPLTANTHHLLSDQAFRDMKSTAILVNTSRGAVVDSKALYNALLNQEIGYAALDVTDPEPLSVNDPLMTLPNCLVVPHIASASVKTRIQMACMAVANLKAGLQGLRLPYCVNPDVYTMK